MLCPCMGLAKLSDEQIQTELQGLEGWSVVDGKLHKEFQFSELMRRLDLWLGHPCILKR